MARADRAERTAVSPAAAPPVAHFSPGIRFGSLLFVSGQTAHDAGDFDAQMRAVLDKLGAILRAGGSDYGEVLRCGVYLARIADFPRMNEIYKEYFKGQPPARTTIECRLARPEILVEIDCVAGVGAS
jgi:enamine deaminase RidA (YjgF/YER057c/UK114 family)